MNTMKAALTFTWFLQEELACFFRGSAVLGSLSNLASLGGNHWAPGPFVPDWGAGLLVYNLIFCPFIARMFNVSWQF